MFLPVLLVRDFGVMGWVVFAVPNCLGAALMGAALHRPGAVDRVLTEHAFAVRAFSLVTTTFQWFFVGWLMLGLGMSPTGIACAVLLVAVLSLFPGAHDGRRLRLWGLGVFTASVLLGAAWMFLDKARVPLADCPPPLLPRTHLAPLAAVCAMGFFLCPYLDATFLLAARRSGPARPAAFLIGFLALFPAMIALTLLYAPTVIQRANDLGAPVAPLLVKDISVSLAPGALLCLHLILQLAFTIGAHEKSHTRGGPGDSWTFAAFLAGLLAAYLSSAGFIPSIGAMAGTEVAYRAFMAFYGLVFPAYVWICAWPVGEARRPTPGKVALAAVATAFATPLYWAGFIEQRTPMLWWGVGIVLLAGLLARFMKDRPGRPGQEGAAVPAPLRPPPDELAAHAAPEHPGGSAAP